MLPLFSLKGEDEEAGPTELTGGDYPIWSVLHPTVGGTHFPQLGQGNPPPGPHLRHIQGNDAFKNYFCTD